MSATQLSEHKPLKIFKNQPTFQSISPTNNHSKSHSPFNDNPELLRKSFAVKKINSLNIKKNLAIADFKLLKVLGKGRFGLVHLAMHIQTGFLCAIKVVAKKHLRGDNEEQATKMKNQFIREIKIQSFLSHPNIIQLYTVFHDDEKIYMVMEYGSNGSLFQFICGKSKMKQETTSFVVRQILLGLTYMHDNHIMHRDIKPENILLTFNTVKICDFGWSVYCSKDVRQTVCGTPLYFPPQILEGKAYDEKIDSWAIGTLTHELLTGQNPFHIRKSSQINKIVTQIFTMSQGSKSSRHFITQALEKDPKVRITQKQMLKHPFIRKYQGLESTDEICQKLFQELN